MFNNSVSVAKKLVKDIDRIFYYTTIIVQVIFLIFYGYSIYNSINHLSLLLNYIFLMTLSTIVFIFYLITYKNRKKGGVKTTKFVFRILKYIINGSMVVTKLIEFKLYGGTDLEIILITISIISLAVQIIIELIRAFVNRYVRLFTEAIKEDVKFISIPKNIVNGTKNFVGLVKNKFGDNKNKDSEKKNSSNPLSIPYQIINKFKKSKNDKSKTEDSNINSDVGEIKPQNENDDKTEENNNFQNNDM